MHFLNSHRKCSNDRNYFPVEHSLKESYNPTYVHEILSALMTRETINSKIVQCKSLRLFFRCRAILPFVSYQLTPTVSQLTLLLFHINPIQTATYWLTKFVASAYGGKKFFKWFLLFNIQKNNNTYKVNQAFKRSSWAGLLKARLSYPRISENFNMKLFTLRSSVFVLAFCFEFE